MKAGLLRMQLCRFEQLATNYLRLIERVEALAYAQIPWKERFSELRASRWRDTLNLEGAILADVRSPLTKKRIQAWPNALSDLSTAMDSVIASRDRAFHTLMRASFANLHLPTITANTALLSPIPLYPQHRQEAWVACCRNASALEKLLGAISDLKTAAAMGGMIDLEDAATVEAGEGDEERWWLLQGVSNFSDRVKTIGWVRERRVDLMTALKHFHPELPSTSVAFLEWQTLPSWTRFALSAGVKRSNESWIPDSERRTEAFGVLTELCRNYFSTFTRDTTSAHFQVLDSQSQKPTSEPTAVSPAQINRAVTALKTQDDAELFIAVLKSLLGAGGRKTGVRTTWETVRNAVGKESVDSAAWSRRMKPLKTLKLVTTESGGRGGIVLTPLGEKVAAALPDTPAPELAKQR